MRVRPTVRVLLPDRDNRLPLPKCANLGTPDVLAGDFPVEPLVIQHI